MKYFSASQEKLLYMALLRLKSSYDDLLDWTEDEDMALYKDDVVKDFTKELVQFALLDNTLRFKV